MRSNNDMQNKPKQGNRSLGKKTKAIIVMQMRKKKNQIIIEQKNTKSQKRRLK